MARCADGTLATGRPGSGSSGADADVVTVGPGGKAGGPMSPGADDFAGDFATGGGGKLTSEQPDTDTARAAAKKEKQG